MNTREMLLIDHLDEEEVTGLVADFVAEHRRLPSATQLRTYRTWQAVAELRADLSVEELGLQDDAPLAEVVHLSERKARGVS